jgi:hypothetical protein
MNVKNTVPARLFVFLARNNSVGVILRRGPSDWVQMIQWHTKTDVFKPGQWFHGRIFERRCDLSADGKYFVYRAFKPGNRLKNPDYGDSWTAVSTPPHFTAKALWVHGGGDGGGGYFYKEGWMLLNHLDTNRKLHPAYRLPKGLEVRTIETYEDEMEYMFDDIHPRVMHREGWKSIGAYRSWCPPAFYESTTLPSDNVTRTLAKTKGKLTLICRVLHHFHPMSRPKKYKHSHAKNWVKAYKDPVVHSYYMRISHTYQYALNIDGQLLELDGVTWADFDRNKRLVLAKAGKLFSVEIVDGQPIFHELADFNENHPPGRNRSSESNDF